MTARRYAEGTEVGSDRSRAAAAHAGRRGSPGVRSVSMTSKRTTPKPLTYMAAVDRIEQAAQALRDGKAVDPAAVAELLDFFATCWRPPSEVRHYPVRAQMQDVVIRLADTILEDDRG